MLECFILNLNRSRQRALLLLVVAMLWIALPASACLLTGNATSQSSCCRSMSSDCPMRGMQMSGVCCHIQRQNATVAPSASFFSKNLHKADVLPLPTHREFLSASGAVGLYAPASTPPDTSPGRTSILRV